MNYKKLSRVLDDGEMITLYHGLTPEALEYVITEGALVPRVCAEGGPKAVYFCEYPLEYPCVIAIDVPKSEIGWSGKRFEVYANKQYITLKPLGIDEYNFRLVKWKSWRPDDAEDLKWWRDLWNSTDERSTKMLEHLIHRFDEYPNTWQWIIEKYLEV